MKHTALIGIALVIFALLVFYESARAFEGNISNSSIQSITVQPFSSVAMPFTISNNTAVGSLFTSNSSAMSFYLVSAGVYGAVSPYMNSSLLLNHTAAYEGNGVFEIIYRNSSATFPYIGARALPKPDYYYNGSSILASGTYYNIYQNTGNSSALVYYSVNKQIQLSVTNSIISTSVYGLFGILLLFSGFGVLIYSVFFKKATNTPKANNDIDKIYAKYSVSNSRRQTVKKKAVKKTRK